ncbi:hypothetical protein Tco_1115732 [Tanacetum coccineum]
MKSRITPNPIRQLPEQNQKGGMKIGAPEARPRKEGGVFKRRHENRRSNETDLLHLGPGRERRVVCLIGARRPGKLADIRRVKTVREVAGSPNQEDTGQTPTKMISLSLGHVRKETFLHRVSGNSISQGQGCPATSRHMMEAGIRKII